MADTWLITGGAGFIGSNLVRWIRANRPDVHLINADCLTYSGNLENFKELEGDDLAALFVYPRRDDDEALVGVVGATGTHGLRATLRTPYFLSGVGIPDYVVFDSTVFERADGGVRYAGFFDVRWQLAD